MTLAILIAILVIFFVSLTKVEVQFAPIIGIAAGIVYSQTDFEEDQEIVHTIQIVLLIVSIQFLWVKPYNG